MRLDHLRDLDGTWQVVVNSTENGQAYATTVCDVADPQEAVETFEDCVKLDWGKGVEDVHLIFKPTLVVI